MLITFKGFDLIAAYPLYIISAPNLVDRLPLNTAWPVARMNANYCSTLTAMAHFIMRCIPFDECWKVDSLCPPKSASLVQDQRCIASESVKSHRVRRGSFGTSILRASKINFLRAENIFRLFALQCVQP